MTRSTVFSIFTPTYNRKHTLHRAYESLLAQTFKDFEWIIIDDGSTDGTEELVREWQQDAPFVIKYHWQPNQGKHIAYNHCARIATGELFVNIDSDDEALPNALERFYAIWSSFTGEEKQKLMAVLCHCQDERGNLIGKVFGKEENADMVEYLLRIKNHG
ncbi:MAG: glycosyl transferase family protein, partial [Chitinophagaceae bacterium]|nr:glycosyl transferase family protein [Chitinophagaceae bacterium]